MTTVADLHGRNLEILALSDAGTSYAEIGRRHGLSPERIRQIVSRESVRRRHPVDRYPIDRPLRLAGAEYGSQIVERLRNLLVRNGYTTPEQVAAATDDDLLGVYLLGEGSLLIVREIFGAVVT
jgi:hypothetical protein